MKLNSSEDWDDFIYLLIYPALLGSMIYEIVASGDITNLLNSTETQIKIAITIIYCLDFLHLYADMKKVIKKELRPKGYVTCDAITSLLLFISFLGVKNNDIQCSLILLSIIPFVTATYKYKVKPDRYFFLIFGALTCSFTAFILIEYWNDLIECKNMLCVLSFCMLAVYLFYVFGFYERVSKKIYVDVFSR